MIAHEGEILKTAVHDLWVRFGTHVLTRNKCYEVITKPHVTSPRKSKINLIEKEIDKG